MSIMPIIVNGEVVPEALIREERDRVSRDLRWTSIPNLEERTQRIQQPPGILPGAVFIDVANDVGGLFGMSREFNSEPFHAHLLLCPPPQQVIARDGRHKRNRTDGENSMYIGCWQGCPSRKCAASSIQI
jgi:hypothetical protein